LFEEPRVPATNQQQGDDMSGSSKSTLAGLAGALVPVVVLVASIRLRWAGACRLIAMRWPRSRSPWSAYGSARAQIP